MVNNRPIDRKYFKIYKLLVNYMNQWETRGIWIKDFKNIWLSDKFNTCG